MTSSEIDGEKTEKAVCEKFNEIVSENNQENDSIFSWKSIVSHQISLTIFLVSICTRKLFVYLITKVKLRRQTTYKQLGMFSIMSVYFINYGVIYLVGSWNFYQDKQIESIDT